MASPSPSLEEIRAIIRAQPFTDDVNVTTWVALSRKDPGARIDGNRNPERSGPPSLTGGHHGPVGDRKRAGTSGLTNIQSGQAWYTPIQVGDKTYNVLVDTGSSDTWLASSSFSCIADNHTTIPQAACGFGPLYKPGPEFKPIKNVIFGVTYGDGSTPVGVFGMAKVTLGGITVNQQLATVTSMSGLEGTGDGITSGYLGLSYPSITFAFPGTDYSENAWNKSLSYNPIFTTMWKEHNIPPIFSVAIDRPRVSSSNNNTPEGYLAFGGLPPVSTTGKWAKADIEYIPEEDTFLKMSLPWPQNQFYIITPDVLLYTTTPAHLPPVWKPLNTELPPHTTPSPGKHQALVDSLYTHSYLPETTANHIASLFSPPAVLRPSGYPLGNQYKVPCDAIVPQIAVQIDGVIFPWDKRDMIMPAHFEEGCVSGVANNGPGNPYTLGATWMRGVLVVHDVGRGEMRFKSRGNY